jgi:hypothetical protein
MRYNTITLEPSFIKPRQNLSNKFMVEPFLEKKRVKRIKDRWLPEIWRKIVAENEE